MEDQLLKSIDYLIDSYNFNITCNDRDDIDRGEIVGIRRTLRLLGFKVKLNDDKTIAEIELPEYAKIQS